MKKNKLIIGISGRANAGKDTVADFLIKQNIIDGKVSVADYLKDITCDLFNISRYDVYNNKTAKSGMYVSDFIKLSHKFGDDLGYENRELSVREVLQLFGTDVLRTLSANCLINSTINTIDKLDGCIYAIPDVRFPNEVEAIQSSGGFVVRLTRNTSNMTHITETALDSYNNFDIIYDNRNELVDETLKNVTNIIKEKMNESRCTRIE